MEIFKPSEKINTKEEIKERALNDLLNWRNNYLDDLPSKKLMPGDENYYIHKCRANFWGVLTLKIGTLIRNEIIKDSEKLEKIKEFQKFLVTKDFSKRPDREDINKINEILDYLIETLS